MPITQSRMIALVAAAQDYQQALKAATEFLTGQALRARQGSISHQTALEQCVMYITDALLNNAQQSATTIGIEAYHFKRNARQNDIKAAQQERKRRGAGVSEAFRHTAPQALQDTINRKPLDPEIVAEIERQAAEVAATREISQHTHVLSTAAEKARAHREAVEAEIASMAREAAEEDSLFASHQPSPPNDPSVITDGKEPKS